MAFHIRAQSQKITASALKVNLRAPCYAIPYHTILCHTIPYCAIPYHTVPRYKTKNGASMRSLYQYVMPHLDNDFKDWCVHRWLLTHSRKLVFCLSSEVTIKPPPKPKCMTDKMPLFTTGALMSVQPRQCIRHAPLVLLPSLQCTQETQKKLKSKKRQAGSAPVTRLSNGTNAGV